MQDGDADWAGYYAWSAGREPRPLLLAACAELGDGEGRMAIDLGCGDGTDALELLARNWSVTAVDTEEAGLAALRTRIPASAVHRIRIVCASFTEVNLPRAHLIHAGFSLRSALRRASRPCGCTSARHSFPVGSSLARCLGFGTAGPVIPA